ncbi:MAG: hypothetical protein QOE46_595 [Acidobacteriota bacterium]|jgi:hypothetical protein|nr:hypothetical protein [Acidobacteriota bacterium]
MSSDNQFTAIGDAEVGFQTNSASIRVGADIAGSVVGMRGHCDTGNGIEGFSNKGFGVKGDGTLAGILGEGIGGGVGVKGTSNFDDGVVGDCSVRGKSGVFGFHRGFGTGVTGASPSGVGVSGVSTIGDGVAGQTGVNNKSGVFGFNTNAGPGVTGSSVKGDGVVGVTNLLGKSGVAGFNDSGTAVFGHSKAATGVHGDSETGLGVVGSSKHNSGVQGHAEATGASGVLGENTRRSQQVAGLGLTTECFGVTGRANAGDGVGVSGQSANGIGVSGNGGTYGATLQGGRAPLRLVPSATEGAPQSGLHLIGEFFVDAQGTLFYCRGNGTPGNWKRVRLADA